jgi:hypothetical protein
MGRTIDCQPIANQAAAETDLADSVCV